MSRPVWRILGLAAGLVLAGAAEGKSGDGGRELNSEEIAARCEGSVALVRGKRGLGTGFLAAPGLLVTNAHVIASESVSDLTVTFPSAPTADRRARVRRLLWESGGRDLAVLAVESKLRPLEIEAGYRFRRGQEVTVIGNPGTGIGDVLENAVSRGVMSARVTYKDHSYFQMSIAINPGNSGGPVFGSEGRVVGVATLKDAAREGIAFCIPADELAAAVARVARQTEAASARAQAVHDHRHVVKMLDDVAMAYTKTLDGIASIMDEGGAAGVDPARARLVVQREFRKQFGNTLHQFTVGTLYPAVVRASADRSLSIEARRDLGALWGVVLDLQKQAEQPNSRGAEIRRQARMLEAKYAQLSSMSQVSFDASAGR